MKSALREADAALTTARRTRGGNETKKELRELEKKVDNLRRAAFKKQTEIAQNEERERSSGARETYRHLDHLAPMGLGVVPGVKLPDRERATDSDASGTSTVTPEDVALQGLARFGLPDYSQEVDRRDKSWHLAREDWQPERDPLPSHAELGMRQRVVSVARTEDGDIAFLNQDGIPVAARFFLSPDNATTRDGWMQSQMRKVFKDTGLHAGHMGSVAQGGPHLIEFVTGQIPGFNTGAQGGFENATKRAPVGTVSIEVSVVVDVPLGVSVPKGYWFEAIAVSRDGTRQPIREATRYFAQRE